MKPIAVLACLALLSCAADPSQEPGADGLVPYAQSKTSVRQIVSRDTLRWNCRTRFPIHGLVVGHGGFLTPQADFYTIDIDTRTIRSIMINREPVVVGTKDQGQIKIVIWIDESASLTLNELNPLIRRMNEIWKNGVLDKPERQPTDLMSSLLLLDASLAFNDSGTATHAPDKTLSNAVQDLAFRHKLNLVGGASTGIPCDPDPPL